MTYDWQKSHISYIILHPGQIQNGILELCVLEHTYPGTGVGKENLISISNANKTQFDFSSIVIKQPFTSQTAFPTHSVKCLP